MIVRLSLLFVSVALQAADIERALAYEAETRDTVFRDAISARWLPDGSFWYDVKTGPKTREFVLVNSKDGKQARCDSQAVGPS
jgi:dipeptidyl-peptidase 4